MFEISKSFCKKIFQKYDEKNKFIIDDIIKREELYKKMLLKMLK